MTKNEILKRYNRAIKRYRKEQELKAKSYRQELKRHPDHEWLENYALRADKEAESGAPWSHYFGKRTLVYGNSRGTFAIDLQNADGHSYRWWKLFSYHKGQYLLNSYRYSRETSLHISHSAKFLKEMGIKYIEIAAPRGLQDLGSAKGYAAYEMGTTIVAERYARNKWHGRLSHPKRLIQKLESIGIKISRKELRAAIRAAEVARQKKNAMLREKRIRRLEAKRLLNNDMRDNAANFHHSMRLIQGGTA